MLDLAIDNKTWQKNLLICDATHRFAKRLKGFAQHRVKVDVFVIKGLLKRRGCYARTYHRGRSLFRFVLEIDAAVKPQRLVRCIAHEMVHISQWLTGKMEDLKGPRSRVRWGKRIYSSRMRYRARPWEREAYRQESKLYRDFVRYWRGVR